MRHRGCSIRLRLQNDLVWSRSTMLPGFTEALARSVQSCPSGDQVAKPKRSPRFFFCFCTEVSCGHQHEHLHEHAISMATSLLLVGFHGLEQLAGMCKESVTLSVEIPSDTRMQPPREGVLRRTRGLRCVSSRPRSYLVLPEGSVPANGRLAAAKLAVKVCRESDMRTKANVNEGSACV